MSYNCFGSQILILFSKVLHEVKSLKELDLSWNSICRKPISALKKGLGVSFVALCNMFLNPIIAKLVLILLF